MKLAIHHRKGSFSEHWISYCRKNKINYILIDGFETNTINEILSTDAFLWHFHHNDFKEKLAAKPILFALEQSGFLVFPNFNTAWHFDDKVAQKYLLESINAPMVPSYVFYEKKEALKWIEQTSYPKVFKLKGGAGSSNVKLVKNKKQANKLANKAFGKGFKQFDKLAYFKDKLNKFKDDKITYNQFLRACGRSVLGTKFSKLQTNEKKYIYFQDFIPNNDSDFRIIVINNKAIAIKRMVRKGDFRASGSNSFFYSKELFKNDILKIAFDVYNDLSLQCCAFDFVYNEEGNPIIIEISYGFANSGYDRCEGYWDENLVFHNKQVNPYEWIIELILNEKLKK